MNEYIDFWNFIDKIYIVHTNQDNNHVVTWNGSLTIVVWHEHDGKFKALEMRTLQEAPSSYEEAVKEGKNFLNQYYEELNDSLN